MAATALIKFTQGLTIGANGQALKGVIGTAVNVLNSDNTDVASWQIDLVYVDPSSAVVPATPYAFDDSGSVASATFTPDVRGSYRFVLKVWDVPNRIGDPIDTDIRVFAVPEVNGLVVPAAQLWPRPLPPIASGEPGAKEAEFNFGGQTYGWAGNGINDGLLGELIRRIDHLSSSYHQESLPVTVDGQTAFTLSSATTSNTTVQMYLNGAKMQYGVDYSVSGATVTYAGSIATQTTDVVEFWYIA
jgi:hypothetical protein